VRGLPWGVAGAPWLCERRLVQHHWGVACLGDASGVVILWHSRQEEQGSGGSPVMRSWLLSLLRQQPDSARAIQHVLHCTLCRSTCDFKALEGLEGTQ